MLNMFNNMSMVADVMEKAEVLKSQKLPPEVCDEVAKQILDALAVWGVDLENIKNIAQSIDKKIPVEITNLIQYTCPDCGREYTGNHECRI